MNNYYKYLPVSKDDESWGLTVLNAGCTQISPGIVYPSKDHPKHHNFNWKNGRILNEYHVIYIINGEGVFESQSQKATVVKAGTVILLFPNEWHRYKPDENIGWNEYWIGIKGPIVENLLSSGFIRPENACIYIGFRHEILETFNEVIEQTKFENAGYQPLISGAALFLLGKLHAISKQNSLGDFENNNLISKAQLLFRSNIKNIYGPEQAADELKVGYSWFRKHFKSYTGLSPGQYYLQLKIEQAKNQLLTSDCSIKNVAYNLNFESVGYFSKIFYKKTGHKPTEFRRLFQQKLIEP